jgi:survival-of-motor-neuron-related-splicing factor 30
METKAEIEGKLQLYRAQRVQVDQLIALDPSNAQFLKLQDDLDKVITLTEALLSQLDGDGPEFAAENKSDAEGVNAVGTDDGDRYSLGDLDDDESIHSSTERALKVGDRVEVTGGAHPFPAIITGIINETEFKVKYYAYEAEVSLPLSCLQRLGSDGFRASEVVVGLKCHCKYAPDQQYYEAIVASKTEHGYIVSYSEYGNVEEVPLEYLRPLPVLILTKDGSKLEALQDSTSKKSKGNGKDPESKLIPIPAKLLILPTDTEEEKQRKKKKIKVIKNKNRLIEQDTESAQVAQSWQKFVVKNIKSTKRALTGLPKTGSMFASSDMVNARVGVVNSGKGMTTFVERKKHKFDL